MRTFAIAALAAAILTIAADAPRAASPVASTTVLATMQPGVDFWLPVPHRIPTDDRGRLWYGRTPIQTGRTTFHGKDFDRVHSWAVVQETTAPTASRIVVHIINDRPMGDWSGNGWVTAPGQVIYYDRMSLAPCPKLQPECGWSQFMRLRPAGSIGSIFGTLYAGTILRPAVMYQVGDARRPIRVEIPAGAVLTSEPQ